MTGSTGSLCELLPCPFCGASLEDRDLGMFHPDNQTDCPLDGLSWRASYYRDAWNTRTKSDALALCEKALENIRGYWPHLVAGLRCHPEARANVQETLDAIEEEFTALATLRGERDA